MDDDEGNTRDYVILSKHNMAGEKAGANGQ
jgi:hypothetical protein